MADSGVLITYGPDFADIFRRAANYVDETLKGARPADLPVEQPTKFKLVVNARTAHVIGLSIFAAVSVRADKVIE